MASPEMLINSGLGNAPSVMRWIWAMSFYLKLLKASVAPELRREKSKTRCPYRFAVTMATRRSLRSATDFTRRKRLVWSTSFRHPE
jgi:hypothetical protein